MRVSRLVIIGLSGLVALHIFMLAGHGHGHDPFAGMRGVTVHASTATSLAGPTDQDKGGAGTHVEMTSPVLPWSLDYSSCSPSSAAGRAPAQWTSTALPGIGPGPTRADLERDHSRSSASR